MGCVVLCNAASRVNRGCVFCAPPWLHTRPLTSKAEKWREVLQLADRLLVLCHKRIALQMAVRSLSL